MVCQYSSTRYDIARREHDAPPPNSHQEAVVCLVYTAVMYTGKHVVCRYLSVYIAECPPSPLRKAHTAQHKHIKTLKYV